MLARLAARGAGVEPASAPPLLKVPFRPRFAPPEQLSRGGAELADVQVEETVERESAKPSEAQTPSRAIRRPTAPTESGPPKPPDADRQTRNPEAQIAADPGTPIESWNRQPSERPPTPKPRRAAPETDTPPQAAATEGDSAPKKTDRSKSLTDQPITSKSERTVGEAHREDKAVPGLPSPPSAQAETIERRIGDTSTPAEPPKGTDAGLIRGVAPVEQVGARPAALALPRGRPETGAPRLSIGRIDVIFESLPPPQLERPPHATRERTRGFEKYREARLGRRR